MQMALFSKLVKSRNRRFVHENMLAIPKQQNLFIQFCNFRHKKNATDSS